MSGEIIPVQENNAPSSTKEVHHQHSSEIYAIQPLDLLDPRKAFNLEVSAHLTGGDYHTKQYLSSEKGHKYVKQLNPTLFSVKPLLDNLKEPSLLLLRGCELLLQSTSFPFDKFKTLTTLEISGCPHLTTLPKNTISQMTQLQTLDLSYLQIDQLPHDLFVNSADSLRSLVIRGCSNLRVLPEPCRPLHMLEYLDLSHLPIQTLHDGFIPDRLRSLILRGCSKLYSLEFKSSHQLHFLDLSHCTSLRQTRVSMLDTVMVLDISYTALDWWHVPRSVSHLFFSNANLCNPNRFHLFYKSNIKVCDLSGNQGLGDVGRLEICRGLEALNLSRTAIQSIDFLSELTYLRTLILKECTRLKQLPAIEKLENLQVMDLSGCEMLCDLPQGLSKQRGLKELNLCGCKGIRELREGLFNQISSLEKLDITNTNIRNLPSFDDLFNRGIVINHSCDSVLESSSTVPTEQSNLMNLCSDNIDSVQEFHLVSTFISSSGFDKFKYKFTELNRYLLFLEKKISGRTVDAEASGVKRQFQSMQVNLEYILGKVDLLESSHNCMSSEELLHQLMSYDYDNYDDPSSILKKLFQTVAKLKFLVPPPPPHLKPLNVEESRKKLEQPSPAGAFYIEMEKRRLVNRYESLTPIQRNCLLYFACLTMPISGDSMIKESILIHLWYGEGFFDPLLYANSTSDSIPGMRCGGPHRKDASKQVSTSNPNSTIEEIGRDILHVLKIKEFIQFQKEEKKWYIKEPDSSFVIRKAMEEHLFDFNMRGNLTPHFGVSKRACFIKSDIDHLSSSRVWLNYTKSSKQMESFETLRTLLYINEPIVDINKEWFSSMTNLQVLNLVNLYSEQINIVDLKFLEELKRMKQLRLLNLESFAVIQKLPESICQLTNLRILNLRYCSNLMELPTGIASLTNLIILDLTQCHLLPRLPKGIGSLSKLEVLKGFPITYKVSSRQGKKACTLKGLLKLERLRKLSLVVNRDSFPDTMDLQVLRSMTELRNLNITWKKSLYKEEEPGDAVEKGSLKRSRWKQLECWGQQHETEEVEDELILTNSSLGNLNKLVLCCFPLDTAPNWLHPTELQNLQRLYIVGGSLRTLFQDFTDQTRWNVQTLKFKYLSNLVMDWRILQDNFPCVTSNDYEEYGCPHIKNSCVLKRKPRRSS